jgi:hypothetical protein
MASHDLDGFDGFEHRWFLIQLVDGLPLFDLFEN